VNNNGAVSLATGFKGNAPVTVNGGLLVSDAGLNTFTGDVALHAGLIFVSANSDLGTGFLTVDAAAGQTAELELAGNVTLNNALTLNNGPLTLSLDAGANVTLARSVSGK